MLKIPKKNREIYVAFWERDDMYSYGYYCKIFTDEKLTNLIKMFHLDNIPPSIIDKKWEEYSKEYFGDNYIAIDDIRWESYYFEKDFFLEKNKIIYLNNFLKKYIRITYPLYSIDMLVSKRIVENFELDGVGGKYLIKPAIWRLRRDMRLEELINQSENPQISLENYFGIKTEDNDLEEYNIIDTTLI